MSDVYCDPVQTVIANARDALRTSNVHFLDHRGFLDGSHGPVRVRANPSDGGFDDKHRFVHAFGLIRRQGPIYRFRSYSFVKMQRCGWAGVLRPPVDRGGYGYGTGGSPRHFGRAGLELNAVMARLR
jgi:hypothetical protein